MRLRDYLKQRRETMRAFSKRVDVSLVSVARYAGGARIPEPDIMRRIVEATGGQVTPNDFYGVAQERVNA